MNQTLNAKMRARMEEVRAQVAERDDFEFLAPLIPTCIALAGTVYPPHEVT